MATVVLIGTLDTKGLEYGFARERITEHGVETILMDVGILGEPGTEPDVSREEVAHAGGADVAELARAADRGAAISVMARGAGEVLKRLYAGGRLDGVLALGGSGGSSLATHAMRELPVGVPKLMVSTVASGDTRPYVGESDVTMMYSVVDIAGVDHNRQTRRKRPHHGVLPMLTERATVVPLPRDAGLPPSLTPALFARLSARVAAAPDAEWVTTNAPYTGTPLVDLPASTPADVDAAFARARDAQETWAAKSVRERKEILLRFHDLCGVILVLERQNEALDPMQAESGKSRRSSPPTDLVVDTTTEGNSR